MKTSCKQILYDYIKANEGWHKKVSLYVIGEDWSPETVGRRLRDLEEEGKIETGYYDSKYANNLVKYILKGTKPQPPQVKIIINNQGQAVAYKVESLKE